VDLRDHVLVEYLAGAEHDLAHDDSRRILGV